MSAPAGLVRAAARASHRSTACGCNLPLHELRISQGSGLPFGLWPRRRRGATTSASRSLASSSRSTGSPASSHAGSRGIRMNNQSYDNDDAAALGIGGGINPRDGLELSRAVVKARGDLPYGSREYRLWVPPSKSTTNHDDDSLVVVARLRAHRNIIFGATVIADAFEARDEDVSPSTAGELQQPLVPRVVDVCSPLVEAALRDAGSQGEQPQAMATLHGLSAWIRSCLREDAEDDDGSSLVQLSARCDSQVLIQLMRRQPIFEADRVALEAVRAISTGVPRHRRRSLSHGDGLAVGDSSTLDEGEDGIADESTIALDGGTMRDGRELWIRLAREYAPRSDEVQLYRKHGAEVTAIELVGTNTSSGTKNDDEYMKSAGGAMARMFFL